MQTVVHVTHEAIQKIGGIGAVLHGLLTSPIYLDRSKRNILVGPFWPGDERGEQRLGPQGEVLYSSLDSLYRSPLAARFREIEQTFDVGIVYGRRKFIDKETGVISTPEVLLIDVSRYDAKQDRRIQVRAVEKVRHRQQQVREHLGLTSSTCAWRSPRSRRCTRWARPARIEPCVILSPRIHGHAHGARGDHGRRPRQLPHDLLCP